jgi:hypothetical protein
VSAAWLLTAGSSVIAVTGTAGNWLTARKHASGWLLILAAQLIGLPYNVITAQWGFIPVTLLAIPASVLGWRNFRKPSTKGRCWRHAMAQPTRCQTPGAMFSTKITDQSVSVHVDLPHPLDLTEPEAGQLEANLHNAVELVLARYFR